MSQAFPESALDPSPPVGPPSEAGAALLSRWSDRRQRGIRERRNWEPTWHICQAFLAGKQWVGWAEYNNRTSGRLVNEPNPQKRERHTVNVITQYLQTVLGKLFVEDLRPSVIFTRTDEEAETISTHTRALGRYIWDIEVEGDKALYMLIHKLLAYGTVAARCWFDRSQGELLGEVPIGPDGEPILVPELARAYVAQAQEMGQVVNFMQLRNGRIVWEPISPFNLIVPPGVEYEGDFPWVMVERAVPLEWAKMRYPQSTDLLRAEDLVSTDSFGAAAVEASTLDAELASPRIDSGTLREHITITTAYEMPTTESPMGRVITFNPGSKIVLDVQEQLPYNLKGRPHHGIVFFHYHRVPGRFISQGLVEPLVGPQRQKNRARSQMIEMKDRNLGRVYAKKGTITQANKPVGKIMELIEIPLHADYPQETTGTPVGPWIENEARLNDEDMDRVSGLREVTMGQAPSGVSAYSAMALLAEQDERRVGPVLKMLREGIGDMMLLSLEMARRYYPDGKQMAIAGPDGQVELFNFRRAQLPTEFYVDVQRHAPLPSSPAVEAQKIFDVFNAATASGQPLPVEWLKTSLDNGRALPIPKREEQVQMSKAEQENIMIAQGIPIMPDYYDDDYLHVQRHREAQIEAQLSANQQLVQLFEMHIQMHAQNAMMKKPSQNMGASLPQAQGGHGIEAQNQDGMMNQAGLAQQMMSGGPGG